MTEVEKVEKMLKEVIIPSKVTGAFILRMCANYEIKSLDYKHRPSLWFSPAIILNKAIKYEVLLNRNVILGILLKGARVADAHQGDC